MMWALLACQPAVDPELAPVGAALARWEEGKAALDRGDVPAARAKLAEASAARPSPLLSAWEAKAAADAGEVQLAVDQLGRLLEEAPDFAEARYNRAAYLARLGRGPEAAAELRQALQDGAALPIDVLEDADFGPWLQDPAFGFLPRQPVEVLVEAPKGPAFWGAEITLGIRLLGLVRDPVLLAADRFEGPLQLLSVYEDSVPNSQSKEEGRTYGWTWKVVGAGPVVLGPTRVVAGKYGNQIAPIELVAEAPAEMEVPPLDRLSLPTPRELVASVPMRTAALVTAKGGEPPRWVAHVRPGDRVLTEPPLPAPARFELRQRGEVLDVALRWPAGAVPKKVTIQDSTGDVVFTGP